jgi:hypothetical protein
MENIRVQQIFYLKGLKTARKKIKMPEKPK